MPPAYHDRRLTGEIADAAAGGWDVPQSMRYGRRPISRHFATDQIMTDNLPFQQRVAPWMAACFGPAISADTTERNQRFLAEALELVQACGATQHEVRELADYVFGRNAGDKGQEVGGVMVTLAALCLAHGLDMHQEAETELARIWTAVEAVRMKQAAKPRPAAASAWQATHRHYKGGLYRVLFEATHSETEAAMTIYETPDGRRWARPAAMFHEQLPDGRQRFAPLSPDGQVE